MGQYQGPYIFKCSSGVNYLHLAATRVSGTCSIVQADGRQIRPGAAAGVMHNRRVGPVNMLPHALWDTIDISINGTNVSSFSQAKYAYKAYLQTLMGYGSNAKRTTLKVGSHFEMDTANQFDNTTILTTRTPFVNAFVFDPQQIPAMDPNRARDQIDAVAGNEGDVNLGWNRRRTEHGNSQRMNFMFPLVHDFFQVK